MAPHLLSIVYDTVILIRGIGGAPAMATSCGGSSVLCNVVSKEREINKMRACSQGKSNTLLIPSSLGLSVVVVVVVLPPPGCHSILVEYTPLSV